MINLGTTQHLDFNKLVECVIKQESAGNPKAVSKAGARGLMQIMPATADDIAKEMGLVVYDLFDAKTNEKMGRYYLKKMLKAFNDNIELSLAAYNWGIGNVKKAMKKYGHSWESIRPKAPLETKIYVRNIMKGYNS
jgi:soluble lytic murein transglycosylase